MARIPRVSLASLAALVALGHCAPRANLPPARVITTQSAVVPAGCEADLSGWYQHEREASYRYQAGDDGQILTLRLLRDGADGGTPAADADAGVEGPEAVVRLVRTSQGFLGATTAVSYLRAAQRCEVQFATELVACTSEALVLRSACCASVSETCRPVPGDRQVRLLEHRLVRMAPAPSLAPGT